MAEIRRTPEGGAAWTCTWAWTRASACGTLLPGNAERGPQGFEQVIEIDDELALLGRRKMPTRSVSVLLGDVTATEDGVQLIGALGGEAHDDTPLSWGGLPKALKREVREVTADRSAHHDHAIAKIDPLRARSQARRHRFRSGETDQSRRAREGERDEPRLGLKSKTPPSY